MQKLFSSYGAILVACLLTFLFFAPHLFLLRIPFPADALIGLYHPFRDITLDGYAPGTFPTKNPLITDPILQAYPWRHTTINNFKNGELPLWNPYSFSGQPLAANIQSAPFAITNLPFLILPFNLAWAISLILPSILTTFFMYLFLRNLKLSKIASSFGAFVLPLTGFFIAWLSWSSIVGTVMWLPVVLLSISKISQKLSVLWFLILTLAISQTILSGHWQAGSYVFGASLLFLSLNRKQLAGARNLLVIITGIVLAIVISMVQILPSLEFLKLSARDLDQGYYFGRQDWFIPRQHLIQLIAPDFFGNPTTYNYWGVFNYGEFVAFIGIVPLALAAIAPLTQTPNVKFFVTLAALALFLGLENPLSKVPFTANLPLISSSQPSRIIFLLDFALVALAAFGLESFLKKKANGKTLTAPLLIFALLVILLILALTQTFFPQDPQINTASIAARNLIIPIVTISLFIILTFTKRFNVSQKIIIAAIFFATFLELFRFGSKFASFSKISWIFPQTQTTEFLKNQEKPFRILTTDRRIFHPNTPAVYGIESVDGYDPLYLTSYNKLVSVWQSGNPKAPPSAFNRIVTPQKYDSRVANLLGVKYVLTFDEIASPEYVLVHQEGQTKIYENLSALPRFYFVDEVIKSQSQTDELSLVLDPNFDLNKMAVSRQFAATGASSGSIDVTSYKDQSIALQTSSLKESPLIAININYPGWQAYIDGQKTEIKEVNFLLQSVIVPAGQHLVELKFQPKSFYNGLYLSLAGLAATALAGFLIRAKRESRF